VGRGQHGQGATAHRDHGTAGDHRGPAEPRLCNGDALPRTRPGERHGPARQQLARHTAGGRHCPGN